VSATPIVGLVFIGLSVDGFIARADGDIEWLTEGQQGPPPDDTGYQQFFDSVDALVMGRGTYEIVAGFDEWPYGDTPVLVLSTTLADDVEAPRVRIVRSIDDALVALEGLAARRVYIDGGATVQAFLRAGLVRELVLTRVPVLIGEGIPLFGPLDSDVRLEHVETRALGKGYVQSRYRVR
jgi:dihydrofolate reductase